jgi:hypothetical protein
MAGALYGTTLFGGSGSWTRATVAPSSRYRDFKIGQNSAGWSRIRNDAQIDLTVPNRFLHVTGTP